MGNPSAHATDVLAAFITGGLLGMGLVITLWVYSYRNRATLATLAEILSSGHKPQMAIAPGTLVYRSSGEVITGGAYSSEPGDVVIPLDARMLSPSVAPNPPFGLNEPRFFSVYYTPDKHNIHTFARTLLAVGKGSPDFDKLDLFLKEKCEARLAIDLRPDCADIGNAYGVKFSGFVYPQERSEPKDERGRTERMIANMVSTGLAKVGGVGEIATMIAQFERNEHPSQQEHPELTHEPMKQHALDIMRNLLERAKSAQ